MERDPLRGCVLKALFCVLYGAVHCVQYSTIVVPGMILHKLPLAEDARSDDA